MKRLIRKNKKKLDNQGFSLVELLVAMALVGVITLLLGAMMSNGSIWFAGETSKADLQNDIQTINTKIQKTLMEATVVSISEDASGVQYILTGEWEAATETKAGSWKTETNPNGTARAIIVYKNKLYIADKYYTPTQVVDGSISKGYEVTSNLEEGTFNAVLTYDTEDGDGNKKAVSVDISNIASAKVEALGEKHSEATMKISYGMLKNKRKSKSSYEVTLRNSSSFTKIEKTESAVLLK